MILKMLDLEKYQKLLKLANQFRADRLDLNLISSKCFLNNLILIKCLNGCLSHQSNIGIISVAKLTYRVSSAFWNDNILFAGLCRNLRCSLSHALCVAKFGESNFSRSAWVHKIVFVVNCYPVQASSSLVAVVFLDKASALESILSTISNIFFCQQRCDHSW